MSTYSTSLKLELITDGDQSGIWGSTTNKNLGTLLEQAITGVQAITMTNTDYTLTNLNGVSDEARNAVLVLGGSNSAIRNVIAPSVNKVYIVSNQTSGGYAVVIKTASGTGVSVSNGSTALVYCDGTNFYSASISGTSSNVANTLVQRDSSGNFAAGTITANLTGNVTGNATSATTATSATSATSATTATTATTATNAQQITNSGGWNVTPSGTNLTFSYNGTNVARLDSSGNLTCIGNVTANGTI